jgi:hypothetical protein
MEVERIFEVQRQQALEETRAWIDAISDEERRQPLLYVGDRAFSPMEIMKEIEEATAYGRIFIEQLAAHRVERAKRWEELNVEPD